MKEGDEGGGGEVKKEPSQHFCLWLCENRKEVLTTHKIKSIEVIGLKPRSLNDNELVFLVSMSEVKTFKLTDWHKCIMMIKRSRLRDIKSVKTTKYVAP